MKKVYGYIRISDSKQEEGVSREAQKELIKRHADQHHLTVIDWYIETCSASHLGRPLFSQMVRNLKQKKADGVIIHKVDRSARNPDDWHELMGLHDKNNLIVQFANNNLDLSTRSGRLTADLEAVIAADFSRNLRDEVKKGQNGRLRQGLYPFYAPLGYLNTGKGKIKAIDPVKAPLIRKLFELYATGDYSLARLLTYANDKGLTNRKNNPLSEWNISVILHNPFYTGLIRVKTTGKTYLGKHKPIITTRLFQQVQKRFECRTAPKSTKHNPVFKSLVRCKLCNYGMPAEKQKGRYYYRCQKKHCSTKTVREDQISIAVDHELSHMNYHPDITASAKAILTTKTSAVKQHAANAKRTTKMQEGKIQTQLERLTDLLIAGTLDDQTYTTKKEKLHLQLQKIREHRHQSHQSSHNIIQQASEILELAFCAKQSYLSAFGDKKRQIAKMLVSNFYVEGKTPIIELKSPFDRLANLPTISNCTHHRGVTRISKESREVCIGCNKTKSRGQKIPEMIVDIVIAHATNYPDEP